MDYSTENEQGVSWKVVAKNRTFRIGLSHKDTGVDADSIEFGLQAHAGGYLYVY